MSHSVPNHTPSPAGDHDLPMIEPEPWVDLVLEPTPLPAAKPRPVVSRAATKKKSAARRDTTTARKPTPSGQATTGAKAPAVAPMAVSAAGKWMVAGGVAAIALAALIFRPSQGHDPLPGGLLGRWTTQFSLYEGQTLEFLPDTVVLTLDNSGEGRYPILDVESTPAGAETSYTVRYRDLAGEKRLDFLTDTDPVTALRFRTPEGLIWVRPLAQALTPP